MDHIDIKIFESQKDLCFYDLVCLFEARVDTKSRRSTIANQNSKICLNFAGHDFIPRFPDYIQRGVGRNWSREKSLLRDKGVLQISETDM